MVERLKKVMAHLKESSAMVLDIKKFKNLCVNFSPEIAIMVRGRHGIGKSEIVYQIAENLRDDFYKDPENCKKVVELLSGEPSVKKKLAKSGGVWTYEMGVPVIERRLSQLSEGDIVGLPFMEKRGTEFKPVKWLLDPCEIPAVIFLDELNRAVKGVEQATFQLADSKAFHGHLLHPGTRIFVAINVGSSYNVEEFDPAAISRYAVVDLEPTVEEWLEYARETAHYLLPEFIANNKSALEHKEDNFEPNKKYPDRRAWIRLDRQLKNAGLYDNINDITFLHMGASMVGFHYANLFWDFVKTNQFNISGKDVALKWEKIRHMMPKDPVVRQQKFIELANKVTSFFKEEDHIDPAVVGPNIALFMEECPPECCVTLWAGLAETKVKDTFYKIHKYVNKIIVKRITGNNMFGVTAGEIAAKAEKEEAANTIVPRTKT